jgi:hypothetical protein
MTLIIEKTVEPLSGDRGQLHVAYFVDGKQVPELSHPVGTPAPIETVRAHAGTIELR